MAVNNFCRFFLIAFTVILLAQPGDLFSQDSVKTSKDNMSDQTDLKDVLKKWFKIKDKKETETKDSWKKLRISILPGVSYNPATDVVIGVSASITRYYGDPKNTSNSTITSGISYTTKNQFKFSLQSSIFTKKNDWSFQGDFRLWKYVQYTYGLGTGTQKSSEQNMKFNFVRLNENVLRRVTGKFYLGIGYSLEHYYDIKTVDVDDNPIYPNIHNEYSKLHEFDSTKYLSSGFVANVNFDNRDNTVNAYKGFLIDAKYYNYNEALGSSSNWQRLDLEFRAFHSMNKKNSYKVALWLMGNLVLNGRAPYMSLPSNGWDKYNAMARGYVQGRFRGRQLLYGEIENRFDLTSNGLIGMVLFANAITVSNPDSNVELFDYLEPAAGVGLRVKFDKYARTNISVDFGVGKHGSKGVFLNIGEFF